MPVQVQQLLSQVEQLTDDREALDKQVMLATLWLPPTPTCQACEVFHSRCADLGVQCCAGAVSDPTEWVHQ